MSDVKKPLYKFSLDTSTGEISMKEIKDYDILNRPNGKQLYKYRSTGCFNYVYPEKMDIVKNNGIYTFNPNINAKELMLEAFKQKTEKAYDEYMKYSLIFKRIDVRYSNIFKRNKSQGD